ncbi:very short patch repair endonuclease [Lichenicoccus roseus]|uniref:DNA mismatch endonuclease Vsr n=1 Tax=Lichenicoccus roseus TaxID=2683649 RepID=A0A5R9J403_9PROT|nr:very short patch repair endonuclease [Lichenicoccus roseus]TLU71227.1 DNA mismatch endonuclease Vsr [Lichenicoccus roseus]
MTNPTRSRTASPRPDFADVPDARRRNLAAVKAKDTKPELLIRRGLFAMGYRFRLHDRQLPGRPDIVFPGRRSAVEVRGCFWHRHGCANSVVPKTRTEWWTQKLDGNVERDRTNAISLEAAGWRLLVVWECEVRQNLGDVLGHIRDFLAAPRPHDKVRSS